MTGAQQMLNKRAFVIITLMLDILRGPPASMRTWRFGRAAPDRLPSVPGLHWRSFPVQVYVRTAAL